MGAGDSRSCTGGGRSKLKESEKLFSPSMPIKEKYRLLFEHYCRGHEARMDADQFSLMFRDSLMAMGLTQRQADDRITRSYMGSAKYSDFIFRKMQRSAHEVGDRRLTFTEFWNHEYSRLNLIPRTSQQIAAAEDFFANWTERTVGVYSVTQSQDDIIVSSSAAAQKPKPKRSATKIYPRTPRYNSSQLLAPDDSSSRPGSQYDLVLSRPISMLSVGGDDLIPDDDEPPSKYENGSTRTPRSASEVSPDAHMFAMGMKASRSLSDGVSILGTADAYPQNGFNPSPRGGQQGGASSGREFPDEYDTKSEANSVYGGSTLVARGSSVNLNQPVMTWHEWAMQRAALTQNLDRKNVASAKFVDRLAKARALSSLDLNSTATGPTVTTTEASTVRAALNRGGSRLGMGGDRSLIPRLRLSQTPVGANPASVPVIFAQTPSLY